MILAACLGALLLLSFCGVASAATFTVNTTVDSIHSGGCATSASTCSLRDAVIAADAAGGANTITFSLPSPQTYTLTSTATSADDPTNGDLDVTGSTTLTIAGGGAGGTTIDANQKDRAFAVDPGASLTLTGVTVTGGQPSPNSSGNSDGGAIYSDGTLNLNSDIFTNDVAPFGSGGAIRQAGSGALTVRNTTFTSNTAAYDGGAIANSSSGPLTITGNTFGVENGLGSYSGGNRGAYEGGAITDAASSSAVIADSTFSENRARTGSTGSGGGAMALSGTSYELDRDEFDGNSSGTAGGAIVWTHGTLTGRGDAFVGNSADTAGGGALLALAIQPLTLSDTTFSNNAGTRGGALDFEASTPVDLVNDTLWDNGNAVFGADGLATASRGVQNTVIAAPNGGGTQCAAPFPLGVDMGHNLSSDNSCLSGAQGDLSNTPVTLSPPANNGGTVLTNAEPSGAPTIDAGTNGVCPGLDARGVSRPQGAACDIGAYEAPFSPPPPQTSTTTVSTTTTVPGPATTATVTAPPPTAPPGTPPSATTRGAMGITPNSAFLGGIVDPHGIDTSYSFQVGTTRNYGLNTVSGHTDSGPLTLETRIGGLKPGTVYHYRLVATSAAGISRGADRTFRTAPAYEGRVTVKGRTLIVHRGKVAVRLSCSSPRACRARIGITVPITLAHARKAGTLVFTRGPVATVSIRGHRTVTVTLAASAAALTVIGRAPHHRLTGTLATRPLTAQPTASIRVTLVLR
ncbi:MAG TPA: choice-of-anchor Q domain-containing protein [Solirubrobacteraceae bacterium]|nr:choice-of-anchor Q domain-containing protein [Solirubrobacteraceae bacterium]